MHINKNIYNLSNLFGNVVIDNIYRNSTVSWLK